MTKTVPEVDLILAQIMQMIARLPRHMAPLYVVTAAAIQLQLAQSNRENEDQDLSPDRAAPNELH